MGSGSDAYNNCIRIWKLMKANTSNPECSGTNNNTLDANDVNLVRDFCDSIYDSEVVGGSYSKPMLWIGNYIAVALLFCILAMAADLFHGFRNRQFWFPCKYFTLNAASITVIAIAMKLPVDLNGHMPGSVDQLAKEGSLAFMCTMMANLMPSLASMDNTQLFANVTGMVILVITIVVNVVIQIETGVVFKDFDVYVYIGAMLYLLVLLISSALMTPTSKRILELKYDQMVHRTITNDVHPQNTRMSTVEEVIQHVRKYGVMAGTCSPQFVKTTTPLCSAAGIVCVSTTILYYFIIADSDHLSFSDYESDYKWSMVVIFITQSIGIVVGTIAPVCRCFATLSFKLSTKWIKKHTKVYEVEKYWTQKLSEWKEIHLAFPLRWHILKAPAYNLHNLILNLFIICQKVIVVSCKIIALVPIGIVIIGVVCVYCFKSLKAKFFGTTTASISGPTHVIEQNGTNEDIGKYVLQLQDEMELDTRILKSISNSVNRLIQKAEKQSANNLLKLVEQCTGFGGVVNIDSDDIQPGIWVVKFPNSWSLPVITLTSIAITIPNIRKDIVDSLFSGVCEGLSYTVLVEESLNNADEYKKIHKATKVLWDEVEVKRRWLGNTLQRNSYEGKNPKEIVKWFADKAEEIAADMSKRNNEELFDNSGDKLIAANSMYRITQTIMHNYLQIIEHDKEDQLFDLISGMIVDIVGACLTNLPRVITMKCHESAIEKREASVRAAATLLGSTKNIIEKLHGCELPSLDPDEMAFIDEWRVHLKHSIAQNA